MRRFVFPLDSALAWRRTQLEIEENKLRQSAAAVEELALALVRLQLVQDRAEQSVRQTSAVESRDLWALASYRQRLQEEKQALQTRRLAAERDLTAQRQKVLEVQRHCRLLEKLEARRRMEWHQEAGRELEMLAAESFLAGWHRR